MALSPKKGNSYLSSFEVGLVRQVMEKCKYGQMVCSEGR